MMRFMFLQSYRCCLAYFFAYYLYPFKTQEWMVKMVIKSLLDKPTFPPKNFKIKLERTNFNQFQSMYSSRVQPKYELGLMDFKFSRRHASRIIQKDIETKKFPNFNRDGFYILWIP